MLVPVICADPEATKAIQEKITLANVAVPILTEIRQIVVERHLEPKLDAITEKECINELLRLLEGPKAKSLFSYLEAKTQAKPAQDFAAYQREAEAKIDALSAQVAELSKKLAEISGIAGC